MRRKKVLLFLLAGLCFAGVQAQNMDMARKMYYYERYKTARAEFEKMVAGAPGNADAQYWLILSNLMLGDRARARTVAQAALTATNTNPLVLVGMGHVELSDGKKEDARSRFETAISMADKKTQGAVLNAVGRAHGTVNMKNSDPDYGIEKLKLAAQKEPKNGDIYINMGDCYRRKLDGGNAVLSYEQALTLEPGNARAPYKVGLVYKTQDNCNAMKTNFSRATAIDGNFMPAWRELYEQHASLQSECYNLTEARPYFDKYTATTDQGYPTDKLKMSFCYAQKDFTCAMNQANELASKYPEDGKTDVPLWKAYIYDQMKDSVNAVKNLEEFFVKETNPENIDMSLYNLAGNLYSKMPGQEMKAIEYYQKYQAVETNKTKLLRTYILCANQCTRMKDYMQAATWYKKIIDSKETPSAYDHFMYGYSLFLAEKFTEAAEAFKTYDTKYPTDWRGSYWAARSYAVMDSLMTEGSAVPYYEKFIPLGEPDAQAKASVISAYRYLIIYYSQIKRDKVAATAMFEKLKLADPTNAELPKLQSIATGAPMPPAPKPPTPPANGGATTPTKPGDKPATGTKPPATGVKPPPKTSPKTGGKPVAKTPVKKPGN
jgi:tetratricopeptide (TPR) repeat protein